MEQTLLCVVALIVFTVYLNLILKRVEQQNRKFPWCRTCGRTMYRTTATPRFTPHEAQEYLSKHKLPEHLLSSYVCPRGHTQMWHVPRLGDTQQGVMIVHDL